MKTLGQRLKKVRKDKGITQVETANKLNINQATYAGYESDKHKPDIEMLSKIADIFSTSMDYLAGRYDK